MRLSGYRHGYLEVDGTAERADLIVTPERAHRGWRRARGHHLDLDDLAVVLADPPRMLVIGTGSAGMMRPAPGLVDALMARGITVEVVPTAAAVDRFNELAAQGIDVAAALHLTC